MESSKCQNDNDIQAVRDLIACQVSEFTIADFEEHMLVPTVRDTVRIWRDAQKTIGFAYIDEYNNLWFETDMGSPFLEELESQIIEWGASCLKNRNQETGVANRLDCSCNANNVHRMHLLKKMNFIPEEIRTLRYSRPLHEPVLLPPLPDGFLIRPVRGEDEVPSLVSLHRAAFGTNNMTVEQRLAMMRTSTYLPEMDLVAVAPGNVLAAFTVCGFDDPEEKVGYTDPIGTHPSYQRMGLAQAVVSTGMQLLKNVGAVRVELGTSSENVAMQKLADKLGFVCFSEKLWFSKNVL